MRERRERFGDFIRRIRLSDPREPTQSDVAKAIGISSVGFLSEVETRQRSPFKPDKIEKFAQFFNLSEDEKAYMYDLASYDKDKIPHDIEELLKYEKMGELALLALRQSKAGNATEEDWEDFLNRIMRRERGESND